MNGRQQTADRSNGWIDWASWWLQIPDVALGWLPWGLAYACRAAYQHRCKAIYSSAPYFTAHLVGLLTKRITRLPWVADFRDPWRRNPFRRIPYPDINRYDDWLEASVVREADYVICNTDAVQHDFRSRYPQAATKFVVVTNGFEPEDFQALSPRRRKSRDKIVVTHSGVFYRHRRPQPIFQALRLLADANPELAAKLCLQLVGDPECNGQPLEEIASQFDVGGMVDVAGKVSYQHSLELLLGSDIQLLVGFNGPGAELQVPGKLFEYFGVGRPILALAPKDSAIADLIRRSRIESVICDPEDAREIAEGICRLVARNKKSEPGQIQKPLIDSLLQFTRRELTKSIAALLHKS